MMKYTLSLCVLFAITYVQAEQKWSKEMQEAAEECMEKDKIEEGDFKKMLQQTDEKALCIMACANEKIGVFKDGKFDIEKVNEEAEKILKDSKISYGSSDKKAVGDCIKEVNESKTNDCIKQLDVMLCFTQVLGKDFSA